MHYDQDTREARSVGNEVDRRYGAANFAGADRHSIGDEVLGLCRALQEQIADPVVDIKQEREAA